jgi:hypothetical protein
MLVLVLVLVWMWKLQRVMRMVRVLQLVLLMGVWE